MPVLASHSDLILYNFHNKFRGKLHSSFQPLAREIIRTRHACCSFVFDHLIHFFGSDLDSSSKLLEDLTSSRGKDKDGIDPVQRSLMNLRGQLQAAEVKVKALEDACAEAEEVLEVDVLCREMSIDYWLKYEYF